MNIYVNGRLVACKGRTLRALFRLMKVKDNRVAVVLNGEVVPASRRAGVRLSEGDKVELVTLAGGG